MLSSTIAIVAVLAAGPVHELPWPCGQSFSCTQGNGGQASHTGFAQYAWDFGMPLGTDVLAARGGVVSKIRMDSEAGGCDQAFANSANYIVIDHGDGTSALYLHVAPFSSAFELGDAVEAGEVIAEVGLTGWTCGAHLHYQVQENCPSWWCQSVPSEFFAAGVIQYPEQFESENCGPCTAALDGGQLTLSETNVQCFDRLTRYWWDAGEGLDGHHFYTLSTTVNTPETIGRWRFGVSVAGDYEVEVYVPAANADVSGASYAIHHGGVVDEVALNQAGQKGWQSLGVFSFHANGANYIELPDNTGDDSLRLAYDSVRLTFVDEGDPTTTGGDPTTTGGDPTTTGGDPTTTGGDPTTGEECYLGELGCYCTEGGGCDPGAICVDGFCVPESGASGGSGSGSGGGGSEDGGSETGAGTTFTGGGDGSGLDYQGDAGCACASGADDERGGGLAWLVLVALAAPLRRRRSQ